MWEDLRQRTIRFFILRGIKKRQQEDCERNRIHLYSATLNPYPKTNVFEHDSRTSDYNFLVCIQPALRAPFSALSSFADT